MYKILALDGGGVRGVVSARILERIASEFPNFLDGIDLVAGTSAGAINAVALAKGLSPTKLVEIYCRHSAEIFQKTVWEELGHTWGLARARYSTAGREKVIEEYIGDVPLGQLGKKVLVATYQLDSENELSPSKNLTGDLRTWKAKFFHNFPHDNDGTPNRNLDHTASDLVMRSSAAPTFFPIYQGFIDGGVVANNPSMCALTQALNADTGGQDIQNVRLLSIGTGGKRSFLASRDGDWGLLEWGFKLVDLMMDTGSGLADYQCRQLIAECYQRVDPVLVESIGLDDAGAVDHLLSIAGAMDLSECFAWIGGHWK